MRVTVSAHLFDNEPAFYPLLGDDTDIEICYLDTALYANQIIVDTTEGKFLISLIRNGPSTVRPLPD